ncbi:hypothetical protein M8J77_020805 [Diaphorina citri]|nr:hypothetical protein M8J77_020805 [Diaphorina citri]
MCDTTEVEAEYSPENKEEVNNGQGKGRGPGRMSHIQKFRKGGALHRRGPPVFYSPTGDPTRDAWLSGGGGGGLGKQKTQVKPKLARSKLSKSKLKLFYEIWKESLVVDAAGNLVALEDKQDKPGGEDKPRGDGKTKDEEEEEQAKTPGAKPELQYSREELYEIQKLPGSQIKPEFLDRYPIQARFSFVKGVWEREGGGAPSNAPAQTRDRWPRAVTPSEAHDGYDAKIRRDTRMSRGKDGQQDPGLILSPQRRSFNSGCHTSGGSLMGVRDGKTMDRDNMGRRFGGSGRLSWGSGGDNGGPLGPGDTTFVAPNLMPDYTQRGQGSRESATQQQQPVAQQQSVFDKRYSDVKRVNNRKSGEYNNRTNGWDQWFSRNSGDNNGGDYNRNDRNDYGRNDYNSGGGRYNNMNGGDRRRNNSDRNSTDIYDEPEWFSEGPTSQNDVIELRGFYDEDKDGQSPEKESKDSHNSHADNERVHRKSSSSSSGGGGGEEGRRSRTEGRGGGGGGEGMGFGPSSADPEPNIDDLLSNLDTFPSLLTNGTESNGDPSSGGGSRFSRWFRKESPGPTNNSPPFDPLHDLINGMDENRPPNANAHHQQEGGGRGFIPISPVFSTNQNRAQLPPGGNFLDLMLKQSHDSAALGGGIVRSGSIRDLEGVGKLHSVEELEAKIRHGNPHQPAAHTGSTGHNKEEDMANFKKLLAKSIDSKKPPSDAPEPLGATLGSDPPGDPSSAEPAMVPQMMSKLLQQQQHHLAQNLQHQGQMSGVHPMGPGTGQGGPWGNLLAAQNSSNYQELVHKIVKIQQAQEYQRRMVQLGLANVQPGGQGAYLPPSHHATSPLPPELQHHLLNNPQFDARNLIRHPSDPNRVPCPEEFLCSLPREILMAYAIEALLAQQATPGVGPLSPGQNPTGGGPNFLQPGSQGAQQGPSPSQAAQQFMLGANSGNNPVFQQRIPSPNQQMAAQAILQNAIKKKIEEQKETLRKRQELLQRCGSPNSNQGGSHGLAPAPGHELRPSSSSPVIGAFTPTSVLRKMTAAPPPPSHEPPPISHQHDKDMLLNHSQGVPWSQLSNRPQQSNSLAHKNIMNLGNQQIPGGLTQQQRQALNNPRSKFTLSSKLSSKSSGHVPQSLAEQMNMMTPESNPQSGAQHANPFTSHHSQAGDMPSTSDQLLQWFSPEFLARARAQGPNTPAQNLLSVEELERERLAAQQPAANQAQPAGAQN